MECRQFYASISALADDEVPEPAAALIRAHLDGCAACTAVFDAMVEQRRAVSSGQDPTAVRVPVAGDVARAVRRRHAREDRRGTSIVLRALLAASAVWVVVLSFDDLVGHDHHAAMAHKHRHLASFMIAYAVLLALVAARPARARTALPIAGVVAIGLGATAVIDAALGRIALTPEGLHLPELSTVLLVWLVAARPCREAPRRDRPAVTARRLRSVP